MGGAKDSSHRADRVILLVSDTLTDPASQPCGKVWGVDRSPKKEASAAELASGWVGTLAAATCWTKTALKPSGTGGAVTRLWIG
jgi:hypothetical protein